MEVFTLKLGWKVRKRGQRRWKTNEWKLLFLRHDGPWFQILPVFPDECFRSSMSLVQVTKEQHPVRSRCLLFLQTAELLQLLHFTSDCKRCCSMLLTVSFCPVGPACSLKPKSETFLFGFRRSSFQDEVVSSYWCSVQPGALCFYRLELL